MQAATQSARMRPYPKPGAICAFIRIVARDLAGYTGAVVARRQSRGQIRRAGDILLGKRGGTDAEWISGPADPQGQWGAC